MSEIEEKTKKVKLNYLSLKMINNFSILEGKMLKYFGESIRGACDVSLHVRLHVDLRDRAKIFHRQSVQS
jgi:hypothetical protein